MSSKQINFTQSVEELEGVKWSAPNEDSSSLILECHRLRKIAVENLTVEHIRMLIGQDIGLQYLVPIALDFLAENPWISGDHYNGDLLFNVLRIDPGYWSSNHNQLSRLAQIMDELDAKAKFLARDLQPAWQKIFSNG